MLSKLQKSHIANIDQLSPNSVLKKHRTIKTLIKLQCSPSYDIIKLYKGKTKNLKTHVNIYIQTHK